MELLQLQEDILYKFKHKPVEIYANGRSSGQTTGVSFKALKELGNFNNITIAYPNYQLLR